MRFADFRSCQIILQGGDSTFSHPRICLLVNTGIVVRLRAESFRRQH